MSRQRRSRSGRAQVAQRALTMLATLQEGDASREELIAHVRGELGEKAYGTSPHDSFENDKRFLAALDFKLSYDRRANRYHLRRESHPLLRLMLTPEELDALSVIQHAFAKTTYADAVAQLVSRVRACLPPYLQAHPPSDPLLMGLIQVMDVAESEKAKMLVVNEAMRRRQWLEFDYRSPRTERTIRHPVQPYNSVEYRDGHLYFEGRNLKWDMTLDYRVDRIVNGTIRLLPNKFAESQRKPILLPLRYRLSAKVARYGATRHFAGHAEERLDDGWLLVTAQIAKDDLFWASKKLLKYGENCVVEEPPELVKEMQRVVKEMAANYHLDM